MAAEAKKEEPHKMRIFVDTMLESGRSKPNPKNTVIEITLNKERKSAISQISDLVRRVNTVREN